MFVTKEQRTTRRGPLPLAGVVAPWRGAFNAEVFPRCCRAWTRPCGALVLQEGRDRARRDGRPRFRCERDLGCPSPRAACRLGWLPRGAAYSSDVRRAPAWPVRLYSLSLPSGGPDHNSEGNPLVVWSPWSFLSPQEWPPALPAGWRRNAGSPHCSPGRLNS